MDHHTVITILEIASAVTAVGSAGYGIVAANIEPKPVWDRDPSLRPKSMEMHNFGMLNALSAAHFWAGKHQAKSALLAIASALCVTIALMIKFHYA